MIFKTERTGKSGIKITREDGVVIPYSFKDWYQGFGFKRIPRKLKKRLLTTKPRNEQG
jgi:hypothetical protein